MKSNLLGFTVFFLIALIGTISSAAFIIPEGRQVVVTQFGKPVRSIDKPALTLKLLLSKIFE